MEELRKVLFIFGTRPEAIKLCPLVHRLAREPELEVRVCVTGQHRGMLDQVLDAFRLRPDYDLDLMRPGQTLIESASRILGALEPVLETERPDLVVVQGDTTSTLCGALAAFYRRIPVAHVEAGLRTGDFNQPFPEEANRVLATRLATLHFAATEWAASNLLAEGVDPRRVWVTGNTVIDAVLHVARELEAGRLAGGDWSALDPARKLIVVTAHRRESFGEGMEQICRALARLAAREDVQIALPVHLNPHVRGPVERILAGRPHVLLTPPLDYVAFVDLMRRAYLLITDSGGVQEEGPSLGKPILVMRDKTERPEAVQAGTVLLVGAREDRIVAEAEALLDDPRRREAMARIHNPYGDGRASERIAGVILSFFKLNSSNIQAVSAAI
jgi:UDP-N-acetylglucosamine 2-epimerase (non-hydrolysing)